MRRHSPVLALACEVAPERMPRGAAFIGYCQDESCTLSQWHDISCNAELSCVCQEGGQVAPQMNEWIHDKLKAEGGSYREGLECGDEVLPSPPPSPPPGPPPPASFTCQCGVSTDYPPISGAWFSSPDCSGAPSVTWALPFFPANEESADSINACGGGDDYICFINDGPLLHYWAGSCISPTTQRTQWCDYSVEPPRFRGERIVGDDCSSTTMAAYSDPADGTCVSNGERGSHRIYCGAAIRSVECVTSAECASECMASCESAGLEAGEESAGLVEGGKSAGLEAGEESADLVGVIVGATVGGLAALILAIALPIVVICCCRKKATAAPPSTAVPATQGVAMPVAKSAPATEQASVDA